jgi:hypothetical protein
MMRTCYITFSSNLNHFLKDISIKKPFITILSQKIANIVLTKQESDYRDVNLTILKTNLDILTEYSTENIKRPCQIDESLVIEYVVDITKTRSNFYLNVSNSLGKLILSVSAGNLVDLSMIKRKSAGFLVMNAIFKLIPKQRYLKGSPVALHIQNKRIPSKFIKKLRKKAFIKCISVFYKKPFNGCRSKKIRSV